MHAALRPDQVYVTVDLLILTVDGRNLKLLLSRRTAPPYDGLWALPGRFIDVRDSAETAARLLMQEMLPLSDAFLEQLYTFTNVNRDPRGRVISVTYLVIVPWGSLKALSLNTPLSLHPFQVRTDSAGLHMTGGDGSVLAADALAFDHGQIIETGIRRLRGKMDYTDICFHFLENTEAFSLSELQTVFEAVSGEKLDGSNFRRAILGRYEKNGCLAQTARSEKHRRGRPAALYRMNFARGGSRNE